MRICERRRITEMLYRISKIRIHNSDLYCFDAEDVFDHLYSVPPKLSDAETFRLDVTCEQGAQVNHVLWYIQKYGLKPSSVITFPRERNLFALFDKRGRHKINSFRKLTMNQVLRHLRFHPVIGHTISYESFDYLEGAFYNGLTVNEIANYRARRELARIGETEWPILHYMVIVGCVRLKVNGVWRTFVIVQNSFGEKFGFKGFAVIPFACKDLFINFWVPFVPSLHNAGTSGVFKSPDCSSRQGGKSDSSKMAGTKRKKRKERDGKISEGRHASKVTKEEKDEEDGLSGTGNTRLLAQPSCIQKKMRGYGLADLDWLIRLYENGTNGLLADEMNNLHELWALLNFLLPEICSSTETFDRWFQISGENDEQEVEQLHKVLQPFLLRRLKSDVEKGLPSKKEMTHKVGMSQMQKQYCRALLQKDLESKCLLNIAMQLRKCTNRPYLFQGAEPGPPYTTGEYLIESAGKMVLLDKLLPKLKEPDSRVLILSQMTRLLDILEDYLLYCGYYYCRIDGNTCGENRDASIEALNKPGSEKFVFLLSTRTGGLGINLATADVILYDSDWNPRVVLQAQDHAHRIGQTKEVQVFRFCTKYTIEEKVIEKAYKKLALDALVIQQGRLAEQKNGLVQMVRFGAEMVFGSKDRTITDEDINRIIAKGEEATAELDAKMKKMTEDATKFKMDDTSDLYDFDDEKDVKFDFKKIVGQDWIEPPKRERKRNYSESEYFKQTMRQSGPVRPKEPRVQHMPPLHDFQFFNRQRLSDPHEI